MTPAPAVTASVAGVVDDLDLEPIGLDELVGRAGLMTRVDRKYVVPLARARELLRHVPPSTRLLEIDGRRDLGYLSTYLDTPDLSSYLAAGRSRRRRWKVRTRSYLDTGTSFLEVKTTVARGQSQKVRIGLAPATHGPLTADGTEFVASVLDLGTALALRPVLTTTYRRSTLFLPSSGTRATVDVALGWQSLQHDGSLRRPGLAVIETKTGATPSEVDRLLWTHGHRPVRISKYGLGMAALQPGLPPLKWFRVLHRDLGC